MKEGREGRKAKKEKRKEGRREAGKEESLLVCPYKTKSEQSSCSFES